MIHVKQWMLLLRVSRSVSRETFLTLDVIMPKKAKGGSPHVHKEV
jgi:hypothetical protein